MPDAASSSPATRPAQDGLSRQIGAWSLTALLVGLTIGSGIFRVPSTVAAQIHSVGGIAIIWVAGALVSLAGALPIVAMTTALPRSGGAYVSLKETYGPLVAFLYGWIKMLVTSPASHAALALIFAEYARAFATLSDNQVHFIAGGIIVMLTAVNIASVPRGVVVQNVSSMAKVAGIAVLAVLILALGQGTHGALAQPIGWGGVSAQNFWAALISVLFTYTSWVEFTYVAGEVRDPVRSYPRALFGAMAIVVVVYLLINTAFLYALPIGTMAKSPLVATTAAAETLGPGAARFVAALVMLSALGALNGSTLANPRVWYAMANDGLLFRSVGAVHPRRGTPHVALLLNMALGLAAVFTRSFDQLTRIFVLGRWPFYMLIVATVFVIPRRRPELAPLCRRLGYPVVPAAFMLFSAAMLGNEIIHRPGDVLPSLGIVAAGIIVYYSSRAWSSWRAAAGSAAPRTAG